MIPTKGLSSGQCSSVFVLCLGLSTAWQNPVFRA